MSRTEELDAELLRKVKADNIEYIRLEVCDISGRSMGKIFPVRELKQMLENGSPMSNCIYGTTSNFNCYVEPLMPVYNIFGFVYHSTYAVLPFTKDAKMARIMFYPLTKDRKPFKIDPRTLCLNQLKKLKSELGFDFYSAFEHEFQMFEDNKSDTAKLKPVWSHKNFYDNIALAEHEPFIFECERSLHKMGVDLETMHLEYAPGQYEWPMKPAWNITAADNSFTYKCVIKQIAQNHNWLASFCTSPLMETDVTNNFCCSGAHFNHSLWKKSVDSKTQKVLKTNVFSNATGDGLSMIAKYWIGGIIAHAPAIVAFACPTVNCYRRIKLASFAPDCASWGFGNRMCMIRVKNENASGTYMEYRLSSAACNSYLVMASLIAAGMDGIRNKILPPKPCHTHPSMDEQFAGVYKAIPDSLGEALECLKNDAVICEAFGAFFIQMFVGIKTVEIQDLKLLTEKMNGDQIGAETKMFSKL